MLRKLTNLLTLSTLSVLEIFHRKKKKNEEDRVTLSRRHQEIGTDLTFYPLYIHYIFIIFIPLTARNRLDVGLLLCIPFACSIGGTGTLTGTDLNLYLAGFHSDSYKEYKIGGVTQWVNNATGE